MAGFLIKGFNPRITSDTVDFHVGEPNLDRRLTALSPSGTMILMLNGEELSAALWGLEQWNEPGPQVPLALKPTRAGVWVAYASDWSDAKVFLEEIEALRFAVSNGSAVSFWEFGQDRPN